MAVTLSDGLANAILDSGLPWASGDILEIRDGTRPASANTAPTGTLLASITLPASPFAAAASRSRAKSGTWSTTGVAASSATWYRLKKSGDLGTTNTTDKRQDGSVTATGGGGDLTLDNVSIAVGQSVTINSFADAL